MAATYESQTVPVAAPSASLVSTTLLIYAIFGVAAVFGLASSGFPLIAPFFGFLGITALIIAYARRGEAAGTWVASHYRWTPSGYVFVPGYWDLAVARRGVLYAPVVIDPVVVVGGGFVYTPYYAVPGDLMMDALFVRPATCRKSRLKL